MGHIKEPKGINFIVDSTPLTKEEKQQISDTIAYYKRTGKKMTKSKAVTTKRVKRIKKTILT